MSKDEKSLAVPSVSTVSAATNLDEFEKLIGEGFATVDTVLFGAKEDGKIPLYVGELIGPGEDIQMGEIDAKSGEVNMMPTWAFHPLTRNKDGKTGVATNVTHVVPASHVVHHACARIYKQAQADKKTAIVGVAFLGKGKSANRNRPLNLFRIFEKYV